MIISQACKKGGVGKTLLTLSLASESVVRGLNTLIIDADPNQGIFAWRQTRAKNELPLPNNITIVSRPDNCLHRDIIRLAKGFDNVFIDCPPQDNLITNSAMLASDFVLVPCTPCDADTTLVYRTLGLIEDASSFNELMKYGIVINRIEKGTNIGKSLRGDILENIKDSFILLTEIEKRVSYQESMSGAFIHEHAQGSKATDEICNLYNEITEVISKEVK